MNLLLEIDGEKRLLVIEIGTETFLAKKQKPEKNAERKTFLHCVDSKCPWQGEA